MHIEPFRIAVPDAVLADLRERLARTRFPDEIPGSGWGYGTALAYMRELVAYWRDRYDWRAAEAALNALPAVPRRGRRPAASTSSTQRGKGPAPFPLVITHGWPGSVAEFVKIIGPLTDPAAHGGDAADAFDVVCPSMPGYGFSDHPREPGMDAGAHRRAVGRADAGPRLRALRRAGRRLGRDGHHLSRLPPRRAGRRHPSQHGGRVSARSGQPGRRPDPGRADRR